MESTAVPPTDMRGAIVGWLHGPARWASIVLLVATGVAGSVDGASPEPLASPVPGCAAGTGSATDTVYLSMDDGELGTELWAVDVTSGTVRLVADLDPAGSADPELLGSVGRILLFTADDWVHGRQLLATDGGSAEPWSLAPGGAPVERRRIPDDWDELDDPIEVTTAFLGTLGTVAVVALGREGGEIELWRTDGTPAGTLPIGTIPRDGFMDLRTLGVFGGVVTFTDGSGLWVTDGTPDGTRPMLPVDTIGDDPTGAELGGPGPVKAGRHRFVIDWQPTRGAGDQLGAPAPNGPDRAWIATVDGPGATPRRMRRLPAAPPGFGPVIVGPLGRRVIVAAAERRTPGRSWNDIGLWASDGTRRGSVRLARLASHEGSWSGDSIAEPWLLHTISGDTMFLVARGGRQLWRTDGTRSGTAQIASGRVRELLAVAGSDACPDPGPSPRSS